MKIQQYSLRYACDTYWIIKNNQRSEEYDPPLIVNESGAMIWRSLENGDKIDTISELLQNNYGIVSEEALEAVNNFLEQLATKGMID